MRACVRARPGESAVFSVPVGVPRSIAPGMTLTNRTHWLSDSHSLTHQAIPVVHFFIRQAGVGQGTSCDGANF